MKEIDNKMKIILVVGAAIVIGTIGLYLYKKNNENSYNIYEENAIDQNEIVEGIDGVDIIVEYITIHVTGEVNYSGVVVLPSGARIVDAIEAAGGETQEADLNKLNLAYVLNDGEKLIVPNKNDQQNSNITYITKDNANTIVDGGNGSMENDKGIININTATKEELMNLPGIGEAIANRVIAYRTENGKFEKIEDIKNVPGIGDSKFNSIKDGISVK